MAKTANRFFASSDPSPLKLLRANRSVHLHRRHIAECLYLLLSYRSPERQRPLPEVGGAEGSYSVFWVPQCAGGRGEPRCKKKEDPAPRCSRIGSYNTCSTSCCMKTPGNGALASAHHHFAHHFALHVSRSGVSATRKGLGAMKEQVERMIMAVAAMVGEGILSLIVATSLLHFIAKYPIKHPPAVVNKIQQALLLDPHKERGGPKAPVGGQLRMPSSRIPRPLEPIPHTRDPQHGSPSCCTPLPYPHSSYIHASDTHDRTNS